MSIDLTIAVLCGLTIGLAAFVQTSIGFGFALVSVPMLAPLIGPETAVVAVTAVNAVLSAWVAWRYRADIQLRATGRYAWTGLLGMPLGLIILLTVSESQLTLIVGVTLLASVCLMLKRFRASNRFWQLALGVLGGAMLTSTGMNGPPLVIGLDGLDLTPAQFRVSAQAIFAAQGTAATVLFASTGLVDGVIVLLVAASAVAVPVGSMLGNLVFDRLTPGQFRVAVLATLAASGAVAVLTAA